MPDTFDARIAELAGHVPIAMLPIRLEARFFDAARELRVRIFPDQIHVDTHEPELTAAERDAGMTYWRSRFESPGDADVTRSSWVTIAGALSPARAAWVVRALTPTNLGQLGVTPVVPQFPAIGTRPGGWSRAAKAAALPARWLVIGTQGGRELFRKWTAEITQPLDVSLDPDDDAPAVADDQIAVQPGARWLVDFEVAAQSGMAVRIVEADLVGGATLTGGVDRLVVIGVDWTRPPAEAASALHDLFSAHVYSDGVSIVPPGTPTNITSAARPGAPPADAELAAALDPAQQLNDAALAGSSGGEMWRALGIVPSSVLRGLPGTLRRDRETAAHLANALWESTLGLYLADFLQPNVVDAAAARLRAHVREFVVPGGPLPVLRVGSQPYGLLPIIAPARFEPAPDADGLEAALTARLRQLRIFWDEAVTRVTRLGATTNLDADLTALLQMTPLASTFRFRHIVGPLTVNATAGLGDNAAAQEHVTDLLGLHLGWPHRPVIAEMTAYPVAGRLRVPLVDTVTLEPGRLLSRDYLAEIAATARTSGSYEAVKAHEDAATLLEALVAHAIGRELHRADLHVIDSFLAQSPQPVPPPAISVRQDAEFVGVERAARAHGARTLTTPFEAARVILPGQQQSVRQVVTAAIRTGAIGDRSALESTLDGVDFLSTRPAEELDRVLRGLLDSYSHRLDAWFTSLATRRLARLRETAAVGVHLGGYGWLDDLRPDLGTPTSQGYLHAPSLAQAATAAVLRSGFLAHRDEAPGALSLDLRSSRVRLALELLEGVAQGQPLAALLGYRFERALRERDLRLAKWIIPFRRFAPLRSAAEATANTESAEAIAARDVVDGVALLEQWRTRRTTMLAALDPQPAQPSERDGLSAELDRLAEVYDAVSDVMTAEAVHQNVIGNNERAGSVLAALDRQAIPPRMDFVRTPRSGTSYSQRVLVLIGGDDVPAAWSSAGTDLRGRAEPRLNAWIARILGDPARLQVAATVTTGGVTTEVTVPVSALGLGPLALVLSSMADDAGSSELEQRILAAVIAQSGGPHPETEIVLLPQARSGAAPAVVGLGAIRVLLRRIHALVTQSRPATAADLALPSARVDPRVDDGELAGRAQSIATAYGAALHAVEQASAASASALRHALAGAAALGVRGALAARAADVTALAEQAAEVIKTMQTAAANEQALRAETPAATAPGRASQQVARLRALLGAGFPVLPRFAAAGVDVLNAAVAARSELLANDALRPTSWLSRMAIVRPETDRLATVRTAAELLGGDVTPDDLLVVQLPHHAGDRWLALETPAKGPAHAELAVVAVTDGAVNFAAPLAGLFCDAWTETIPSREETTGIAFHHDAPSARPPQAILIAVAPQAANATWSVDTIVDTVVEAHQLARIRAVDARQLQWLGTVLPALYLPESLAKDMPTVNLEQLLAKYDAANAATAGILGKG